MIKLTKKPILPNCQVPNDFFGIYINFIIQKIENKHLVEPAEWQQLDKLVNGKLNWNEIKTY